MNLTKWMSRQGGVRFSFEANKTRGEPSKHVSKRHCRKWQSLPTRDHDAPRPMALSWQNQRGGLQIQHINQRENCIQTRDSEKTFRNETHQQQKNLTILFIHVYTWNHRSTESPVDDHANLHFNPRKYSSFGESCSRSPHSLVCRVDVLFRSRFLFYHPLFLGKNLKKVWFTWKFVHYVLSDTPQEFFIMNDR